MGLHRYRDLAGTDEQSSLLAATLWADDETGDLRVTVETLEAARDTLELMVDTIIETGAGEDEFDAHQHLVRLLELGIAEPVADGSLRILSRDGLEVGRMTAEGFDTDDVDELAAALNRAGEWTETDIVRILCQPDLAFSVAEQNIRPDTVMDETEWLARQLDLIDTRGVRWWVESMTAQLRGEGGEPITNPALAVRIDADFAEPHKAMSSVEDWVENQVRSLEEIGAGAWISSFLLVLSGTAA